MERIMSGNDELAIRNRGILDAHNVHAINVMASQSQVGIEMDEAAVPIHEPVRAASELLGLDPLYVANEGELVAIVDQSDAPSVLRAMRSHRHAREATIIRGRVVLRTLLSVRWLLDMPAGELLPRIC